MGLVASSGFSPIVVRQLWTPDEGELGEWKIIGFERQPRVVSMTQKTDSAISYLVETSFYGRNTVVEIQQVKNGNRTEFIVSPPVVRPPLRTRGHQYVQDSGWEQYAVGNHFMLLALKTSGKWHIFAPGGIRKHDRIRPSVVRNFDELPKHVGLSKAGQVEEHIFKGTRDGKPIRFAWSNIPYSEQNFDTSNMGGFVKELEA